MNMNISSVRTTINEIIMANKIEELSCKLINSYTENKSEELSYYCNTIVKEISKDTYQFTRIRPNYIVSKALFYSLYEINPSHKYYNDMVLVTYYSLLRCIYSEREDDNVSKADKIAASALAFVLIDNNHQLIGEFLLNGHLISNTEGTINNVIAQIVAYYWNYKHASINIVFDKRINKLLEVTESTWKNRISPSDNTTQNKVRNFVDENNKILLKELECILIDLHSKS